MGVAERKALVSWPWPMEKISLKVRSNESECLINKLHAAFIHVQRNYIQRPVQNCSRSTALYSDIMYACRFSRFNRTFEIEYIDWRFNIVKTICLKGFRNIYNDVFALWYSFHRRKEGVNCGSLLSFCGISMEQICRAMVAILVA